MNYLFEKAEAYLNELSIEIPERAIGTEGNLRATLYFSEIMKRFNFKITSLKFDCIDWVHRKSELVSSGKTYPVLACPYTLPCNVSSELVIISERTAFKNKNISGKIALLKGDIVKEQLIPKNFKFYNPEEHLELHELLENSGLKAIIAATSRDPGLAGGMYPFPFTEDGDFNIPSAYMKDVDGEEFAECLGKTVSLIIDSNRISSKGYNISANIGNGAGKKIIVCAHIDSKLGSPGAIDNASGVVVLMLLGELLEKYSGKFDIELVALNGEDYFSTPGQLKYLEKLENEKSEIELVINMDGAGYYEVNTAISTYNCEPEFDDHINAVFLKRKSIERGEEWVQSDHSMFAQQGIKCIAITSMNMIEKLCYDVTHTEKDVPEIIDCRKLVDIAAAIRDFIDSL